MKIELMQKQFNKEFKFINDKLNLIDKNITRLSKNYIDSSFIDINIIKRNFLDNKNFDYILLLYNYQKYQKEQKFPLFFI